MFLLKDPCPRCGGNQVHSYNEVSCLTCGYEHVESVPIGVGSHPEIQVNLPVYSGKD